MVDNNNLGLVWQQVLQSLSLADVDMYFLDDSAGGGMETASYVPPPNATGRFVFISRPAQEHWQGGTVGTGTNNSPDFRQEVLTWLGS